MTQFQLIQHAHSRLGAGPVALGWCIKEISSMHPRLGIWFILGSSCFMFLGALLQLPFSGKTGRWDSVSLPAHQWPRGTSHSGSPECMVLIFDPIITSMICKSQNASPPGNLFSAEHVTRNQARIGSLDLKNPEHSETPGSAVFI